ncbi:hypothetical protein PRK78_006275 [Emydomyces testavorans]|uniref:MFS general substrate transporter n=1 Tax=Emydomyces testavorans TaxID=2070801 RepID=A0AAF0DN71_9EURO|nr:hypothetical protein PRK78_006275 [Emydomyces testavorans]
MKPKADFEQEKRKDETFQEVPVEDHDSSDMEQITLREKTVIRKVDWRLLPILGALYAIALIDRVNISNARIAGMEKELKLDIGNRYSVALLVFFIPYFIFELPSNIILRRVGSANWLAFIAFAWGTFMLGQGFITNYTSLVVFRFFLGLFESGGFSSILAFGLMHMNGIRGYLGWRWIFIIEGLITQLVAILSWFLIIDFPHKAQKNGFLTEQEAKVMQHRIDRDRQDAMPDPLTLAKVGKHLCDLKLWAFYALSYFSPLIIQGMGYSASVANLLNAPPYVFSVISAFFFAWLGDKWRIRGPIIMLQSILCITGLMLTAHHRNNAIRFLGIFLNGAGCHGNIPALLAYQSNNIRTQSKRAVGSALQIGFGAIGGILASTAFRQADAPRYVPGLWTTTGLQFVGVGLLCVMEFHFWRRNKQVDEKRAAKPIEGLEGFKYTL